jgi:uncharacterized protein
MIRECIVTTQSRAGIVHIAPLGLIEEGEHLVIAPFRPSLTLDNLRENPHAVANYTDDVLVFAGCLTGRRDWPTRPAAKVAGAVLAQALAHAELRVVAVTEDAVRPRFRCEVLHEETHAPFRGFNRARAAVVEAAILVSRLHMLPADKIDHEIAYLRIAIDKTAGPRERQAWDWLMERVVEHQTKNEREQRA